MREVFELTVNDRLELFQNVFYFSYNKTTFMDTPPTVLSGSGPLNLARSENKSKHNYIPAKDCSAILCN